MTPEDLAARYPRLFHLTIAGAVESIKATGLLSTSALLTLCNVPDDRRRAIERCPRKARELITHETYGVLTITDNSPLHEGLLDRCLDGMSREEWYLALNQRVFFWANEKDMRALVQARRNRRAACHTGVRHAKPSGRPPPARGVVGNQFRRHCQAAAATGP